MASGSTPSGDKRPVVVETVSSGRMIALLIAAVGLSILTTLIVAPSAEPQAGPDATATATEGATAQPASTDGSGEAGGGALMADDVLPSLTARADLAGAPDDEVNVAQAPEMPPAATRSDQAVVDVAFEVVENVSTIDPSSDTEYETWGYKVVDSPGNDLVVGTPGPVVRARVGDVLRFTITNPEGNQRPHNVDFHAVTGQGGGAEDTTVAPGETTVIEARLLYPGFFMYHCAYGDVPLHIARGMYGGILVDPADPLPEVDHEWYVIQSEYYTMEGDDPTTEGNPDLLAQDLIGMRDETPSHVVFNGAVGALTDDNALQMQVGERSRIYFVNAGLNLISSLHPIGSHWDRVYQEAALLNDPLRGSQTTLVPAGGGTVVELVGQVPMTALLVDHALSRTFYKGALGHIVISGEENTELFDIDPGEAPEAMEGGAAPAPTDEAAATAPAEGATTPAEPDGGGAEEGEPSGETLAVSIPEGAFEFRDVPADDYSESSLGGYDPATTDITVGTTVTWTNDDSVAHTVTAPDGSIDSGFIEPGDSWSFTFGEAMTFNYLCTPHPWMRGQLVIS